MVVPKNPWVTRCNAGSANHPSFGATKRVRTVAAAARQTESADRKTERVTFGGEFLEVSVGNAPEIFSTEHFVENNNLACLFHLSRA
jgi:hypothetical protein